MTFKALLAEFRQMRADLGMVTTALAGQSFARCRDDILASQPNADQLLDLLCRMPADVEGQRLTMIGQLRAELDATATCLGRDAIDRALTAMARVPRERFIPGGLSPLAYLPMAGDIGYGQTISHPAAVAIMTAGADPDPNALVLDVGCGSGYQAAVLATTARRVVSYEIVPQLAARAKQRLISLGYENIEVVTGDAIVAAPDHGRFDAIVVAARCADVPTVLIDRLVDGGRLVVPIGEGGSEELMRFCRRGCELDVTVLGRMPFVPLTGMFRASPSV